MTIAKKPASGWQGRREAWFLPVNPSPNPPSGLTCYLARRRRKLSRRSYWIDHPHRFTHDLEELGRGLAEHGLDVPLEGRDAVALTRYAVETRYPGTTEPVTEEDYRRGLELAEGVVAWAEEILSEP